MSWIIENAETIALTVSLLWNAFLQIGKASK